MEPRNEKMAEKAILQFTQFEDRTTPSLAIDVLGVVTVDLPVDLQVHVATPLGINVDVSLVI